MKVQLNQGDELIIEIEGEEMTLVYGAERLILKGTPRGDVVLDAYGLGSPVDVGVYGKPNTIDTMFCSPACFDKWVKLHPLSTTVTLDCLQCKQAVTRFEVDVPPLADNPADVVGL